MKRVFTFFLRLFGAFVAAKLVLRAFDSDTRGYLIGLTLLLLANLYVFDFLEWKDRRAIFRRGQGRPRASSGGEEGEAP